MEFVERRVGGSFDGALIKNEHRITDRKSILICGPARGGTSFAASVFLQLGVPFRRTPRDRITRRHEHKKLFETFSAQDLDGMRQIVDDFCNRYPVWAWKLPAIERYFSTLAEIIPNPHLVLIFKEPFSVAVRRSESNLKSPITALHNVLVDYQRMATIAATTEYPLLLISYDRAVKNLPAFLVNVASFAGITSFDEDAVIAGIQTDGNKYFQKQQS